MDKTERQREHFNSIAERYREARSGHNHLLLKSLIWSELLASRTELQQGPLSVLEAMCGYADGEQILATHLGVDICYSGFDYSDEVVTTLQSQRPELNVWQQDVGTYQAESEYDLVIIIGGLHHVPHAATDVVVGLARALKPGGWFVNFEPTSGNPLFTGIRQAIYKQNPLFDEETERAFAVGEYLDMFKAAKLEPVDVFYPGLLAYVLYYNPDAFPWLNFGGEKMVKSAFALDRLWYRNRIGRALSFATLGLWRKPETTV